jgi:predicted nucleic acid-binding Zn ribbon protein
MRKSSPEPISDVLKKVIQKLDTSGRKKQAKLDSAWRVAAGDTIAKHTRVQGVKKQTLFVLVDDSAWFYEANLKKEKILKSLRRKKDFEKVEKISFRIGRF